MQVDSFPSVRVLRSHKRSRSPEPECERPVVRLCMGLGFHEADFLQKRLTIDSRSMSRRTTPEDWVRQTGGLTIDSPVIMQLEDAVMHDGSSLAMEYESATAPTSPYLLPSSLSSNQVLPQFPPHTDPLPPSSSPHLNTLTANSGSFTHHVGSPQSATTFSPDSQMPPRKQRFTMGPRSDCEKCQLGVKGHWMHPNF
ncbi:hypothetical protein DL96DRAFT_1599040 [Flagelloscypha sp. PMI_526]|nr:hypothetical protein DL96DRAFT_1599040 [Flagelloscypha sp. PMI_526]